LKKNHEHLLKLKKRGYKMVLYSNLRKSERYKDIENDVPILTNLPAKPDIEGYQIACDRLGLTAKEVIMVGDNYITDAGSINCGIPFVKVKPIKNRLKSWPIRIKLIPYVIARGFYSTISDIHQFFRKKV
jgi:predicted HAD superfamily phosphohydrolase YqeG